MTMMPSKRSLALVLELIEDRIKQLDPLLPQDGDDLERLLRCREEMKLTAGVALTCSSEPSFAAGQGMAQGGGRPLRARTAAGLSLDVI
jgi:hypothetical protein